MTDFTHIRRVIDVKEEDIAGALSSREATRELLDHLAKVSQPASGASKVMLVFGHMATVECEWLEGGLRVDIVEEGGDTVVESYVELGGNARERLFAPLHFRAPLEEFTDAIERAGHLIAPLTMVARSRGRVSVSATVSVRMSSLPPAPVAISDSSLFVAPAAPRTPEVDVKTPVAPLVTQQILDLLNAKTIAPPPPRAPTNSSPEVDVLDEGWGEDE
jgi:hypothetical protein